MVSVSNKNRIMADSGQGGLSVQKKTDRKPVAAAAVCRLRHNNVIASSFEHGAAHKFIKWSILYNFSQ